MPKEPDYPCYMQMNTGRVVDLTARLCPVSINPSPSEASEAPTTEGSGSESSFLQAYKKRVALLENLAVAKLLTQKANQNPNGLAALELSLCNALAAGLNRDQIQTINDKLLPTDAQDTVRHLAGLQSMQILLEMTDDGYCTVAL